MAKANATVVMESVCEHAGRIHAVKDFMAERDEGELVRVGPRTYCGAEVGLCQVMTVPRTLDKPTAITCDACVEAVAAEGGPVKKKRRWWRRKKRRK